jgi:hypothetical protein
MSQLASDIQVGVLAKKRKTGDGSWGGILCAAVRSRFFASLDMHRAGAPTQLCDQGFQPLLVNLILFVQAYSCLRAVALGPTT